MGESLDTKDMILDIEHFKQMGVYQEVPVHWTKVLVVRWVGMTKADGAYRSMLVATEIKMYNASERFAATPPIELLKYTLRRAVQGRGQVDACRHDSGVR